MYFVHTPGLKVVCPSTAYDAKGLIKSAIRDTDPVLYFEHKFLYRRIKEELPTEDFTVPIGKAVIRRKGRDISVITYGAMVYIALDAAKELEKEGIDLEVLDLRSLLPFDREAVLETVEENQQGDSASRRHADRGICGRTGGTHFRRGVRISGRPDPAHHRARHAGPLQSAAGGIFPSQGFGRRSRGARTLRLLIGRTMAETKVIMPQMGESIFEGTLTKWLKKPGDTVERDEPLFEISTDKIDSEIPSPAAGTLQKIWFRKARRSRSTPSWPSSGTEAQSRRSSRQRRQPRQTPQRPSTASAERRRRRPPSSRQKKTTNPRTDMSHPLVRRLAREHGIDLAALAGKGTGINGRITKNDILSFHRTTRAPHQPAVRRHQVHRRCRTRAHERDAQVDRRAHGDEPADVGSRHDVLRSGLLEHHGSARKAEGGVRTLRGRS